jgi:hypothetical protein
LAAAMLAVLTTGCAPDLQFVQVVAAPRSLQVRGPAEVQTFLVTPPARRHLDIATLWTSAYGKTVDELIVTFRTLAGRHGCDALVITNLTMSTRGWSTLGWIEGSCEIYSDAASR